MANLVNVVGGVAITLPDASTDFGQTLVNGVNHLNGATAIYYARDPDISNQARLLRQENLVRAVLVKIADEHLLTNPITAVRVLNSIKSMLTVDSDLTNSQIVSLATNFGNKNANAAIYVTAVTHTVGGRADRTRQSTISCGRRSSRIRSRPSPRSTCRPWYPTRHHNQTRRPPPVPDASLPSGPWLPSGSPDPSGPAHAKSCSSGCREMPGSSQFIFMPRGLLPCVM